MNTLIIDAAAIGGMEQLHGRFYAAFEFPECYGENLDALYDYLCEIVKEYSEIKIRNSSKLEQSLGEKDAAGLRRVLADASRENPHIKVIYED